MNFIFRLVSLVELLHMHISLQIQATEESAPLTSDQNFSVWFIIRAGVPPKCEILATLPELDRQTVSIFFYVN